MHRAIKAFIPVVFCLLMLAGCTQSRQVENQAYIIVLGVDANESGEIELSAKIPALSSAPSEGKSSSSDSYKHFYSRGANYNIALKNLHKAAPRNLNLSHLELLVISEELARSKQFRSLIEDIAQTERLYTASYTVICRGNAAEYVKALEPAVGSRLSLDIPARFENYSEQGFIPDSRLADIYYLTESIYSDPVAAIVALNDNEASADAPAQPYTKTRPVGTAVLTDGLIAMEMNEKDSVLTNLLRNEIKYFRYEIDGSSIEAAPSAPVKISVNHSVSPIKITIKLALNIGTQEDMPDEKRIKAVFENDFSALIHKAQSCGAEPFGFAKIAARKFPTIQKWLEYGWASAYENADISVTVSLTRWDA